MNKDIIDDMFPGYSDLVDEFICPSCKEYIDPIDGFRNKLSRKEYTISGLCQGCQDSVFGED